MRPNLQETVDLVTFTEKNFIENFIFCAVVLSVFTQTRILDFQRANVQPLEKG